MTKLIDYFPPGSWVRRREADALAIGMGLIGVGGAVVGAAIGLFTEPAATAAYAVTASATAMALAPVADWFIPDRLCPPSLWKAAAGEAQG